MYRERASSLAGAVVWQRTIATAAPVRVLPDGCMDLMWTGRDLLVAGPDSEVFLTAGRPGSRFVGLRFPPGTAPTLLGHPAHELRDRRVPLADLWPAAPARRLTAKLAAAGTPGAVAALLEEVARDRLHRTGPPDPALAEVARGLAAGATVAATADALGWGVRHLHRRCLDAFGYGPKTLARILRLHRALDLARAGRPFADVAASAGYADQAHLAREVKALSGATLSTLLAA